MPILLFSYESKTLTNKDFGSRLRKLSPECFAMGPNQFILRTDRSPRDIHDAISDLLGPADMIYALTVTAPFLTHGRVEVGKLLETCIVETR